MIYRYFVALIILISAISTLHTAEDIQKTHQPKPVSRTQIMVKHGDPKIPVYNADDDNADDDTKIIQFYTRKLACTKQSGNRQKSKL